MKKCPYCGREFPDDLVVCPIDQTPFDQNDQPQTVPHRKVDRKWPMFFWQLFGGICALFYIELQELHFDVFSDANHFKKALVKLWPALLLSMIWLIAYFRVSKREVQ
ncbi:MAG TPA: hypothetical protein VGN61_04860 [Verrucomicrobiae bacterium]|jgi:hypothetical protein